MLDASPRYWHHPVFDRVLCGHGTDRERLGLPDRFMAARFADIYPQTYQRLRGAAVSDLVSVCENAAVPLVERLAAGNLLAVVGDPRLRTLAPVMVAVTGAVATLGLAPSDVDGVIERFPGLGLDRAWIAKECPRYQLAVEDFAIAKYAVTNLEYRNFLEDSGYPELPSSWQFRRYPVERANHPVYTVSAAAADRYCAWLAARTGRRFRLPTEAEWEFAAAGPEGFEFPWGNDFGSDRANTCETGIFDTTPVGIFAEGYSPSGIADLAGNVEEYVADDYAPYPGGVGVDDHLAQIHTSYRVARGGAFTRFRDLARTRRRHGHNPRSAAYAMGFRLAESLA